MKNFIATVKICFYEDENEEMLNFPINYYHSRPYLDKYDNEWTGRPCITPCNVYYNYLSDQDIKDKEIYYNTKYNLDIRFYKTCDNKEFFPQCFILDDDYKGNEFSPSIRKSIAKKMILAFKEMKQENKNIK